ncbi:MAG TPA: hypothetical protein VFV94_17295 [Polyangiaceae bacterium]|nr:hypothetical protein [Polyangiaceae bacterium]
MRPNRNRERRRRGWLLAAALALCTAEPRAAHAADAVADAASNPTAGNQRARVVLVADVGSDPELPALLRELLERQQVEAQLERTPRFDPEALFAEQTKGTLGIFIALRTPREARLYFRAPGGERYLVRKLSLPSGLDAVGRELVGQVVASSAEALLGEAEALSREQASAEIANEAPASSAALAAPPEPTPPPSREPESHGAAWDLRVLARYSALWLGSDFGLRHGPGVSLGARFGQSVLLGTELGGEYHFEQSFTTPEANGHLRTTELHAFFEGGLRFGTTSSATLVAGPRLELSDFRLDSTDPTVTPAGPSHRTRPGLRLEARYEWTSHHVILGVAATLDLAFARVHYDLSVPGGGTEELAWVWPVRPGFVVSIGVH